MCAVVMILTRKGDILTDSEIADLTGVDRRCVNQLRRGSDRDQGPRQVVSRAPRAPMASRKVRKAPSNLGDWPLGQHGHLFKGHGEHRPSLAQDSGRRSSLGVAARPGPLPWLQQVCQVAQGPLLRLGLKGLLASQQS
jgi:hypothetical protein